MNKTVLLILLILVNLNVFCQGKMKKEIYLIEKLEVINSNLFSTLDTIIQMKEEIQWYKETMFFIIEFNEDSTKTDLIYIRAYEKIDDHYSNIIGFFDYKKHAFVIRGNTIDTTIFQKTNKKRSFEFGLPKRKYTKEGEPIMGQFDTFAVWSIRYKLGKFKILSFFTHNESDTWFNYIDKEYNEK